MDEKSIRDQHSEMVFELSKSPAEIKQSLTLNQVDILHALMGVVGEAGEIAEVIGRLDSGIVYLHREGLEKLKEELGDFEFYLTIIYGRLFDEPRTNFVSRDVNILEVPSLPVMKWGLLKEVSSLTEVLKKHIIYGKPIDVNNLKELMGMIEFQLLCIRSVFQLNHDEILMTNIKKLRKRYPEGYSNEAAKKRADEV